ncbi:MAG: sodium:alanine symporter family protein [Elusimicrobiota bacterium]
METLDKIVTVLNSYLWGPPMLALLFGTHIFLTFRTKFIQRYTWLAIKLSITKDPDSTGDVSQFGALTTALAATIGTGNIVGVATAVALGGPGAVLWLWLTGVFGIATKYSEALLAVKYRVKTSDGTMLGGPMYALERGLNLKWLAVLFSIFTALAAFGIGNTVQANSIASLINENFGISPYITGIVCASLTALVILGGIKTIALTCNALVPFMAGFYILGCAYILVLNGLYILPAIELILKSAFTLQSAGAGLFGATLMQAMRYGIARGLFSNESGLGSAPIVAAAARTKNPVRQALVSSTGTFWDTVIVCAMTGLVLVTTIIKSPDLCTLKGIELTKAVFNQIPLGNWILTIGLFTFVYSTILGWSYYGEKATEYLLGKKSVFPYRILWVLAVFVGAIASFPLVWNIADMLNALMALPNLVALILLNGVIVKETEKFLWSNNLDMDDNTETK